MKTSLENAGIFIICMTALLLFFVGVFRQDRKLIEIEHELSLLRAQVKLAKEFDQDNVDLIFGNAGKVEWLLNESRDLRDRVEDLDPENRFKPTGSGK